MEEQQQGNPRLKRGLIVSCVVALLIYAGMVAWADTEGVQESLERLQPMRLFAALGLVLLGYVLRFVRWELYRQCVGIELARGPSALIFLSGLALTVSPGKLGEAFKCVLLKEETKAPVSRTAPIVLAERLTDLLSLLVLITIANLSQHAEHTWILWVTLLGCLGLLGLIGCPPPDPAWTSTAPGHGPHRAPGPQSRKRSGQFTTTPVTAPLDPCCDFGRGRLGA